MARFVIRLDDICPTMRRDTFAAAEALFDELGIRPLIGVVPDNRDESLCVDEPEPAFWDRVRQLAARGWTIAQHGYRHVYCTGDSGILKIGKRSEFAGLSYPEQLAKVRAGRVILESEGVGSDIFMAPAHSFDERTLRALRDSGFRYVTDGFGLFPYKKNGLTFVPQLFANGSNIGIGVYTVCLHLNTMSRRQFEDFECFARGARQDIIGFREAAATAGIPWLDAAARPLIRWGAQGVRKLRTVGR